MAGHNKWSKIKRKKEVIDAKKSKLFGSLIKTIQLEMAKTGNKHDSIALKAAINRAKQANLPSQNIERAIAAAQNENQKLETICYEAYGPGGSALIIEGATNNKNRTSQAIKQTLSEGDAQLATPGTASWAFEQSLKGNGWVAKNKHFVSKTDREKLNSLVEALIALEDVERVAIDAEL